MPTRPNLRPSCRCWLPLLVVTALSSGCLVPQSKYDEAVRSASDAQHSLSVMSTRTAERVKADEKEIEALKEELRQATSASEDRDAKLSQAGIAQHNLQAQLDESTAMNQQLRAELTRLGKNVDQLLSEKGTIARSLDEARARLDELRRAQAAAESRQKALANVAANLKELVQAGQLSVITRNGVMVLVVPSDLLFEGGKADMKPAGQKAIKQIAAVLKTLPDRRFQVRGHTDSVAARTPRFASNWDLSASRAVEIVRQLITHGVRPESLGAAGYAEFDPVAPGDTVEGRAKNRRIEIIFVPKPDELYFSGEPKG
jgi:chemotaxis protein MotB